MRIFSQPILGRIYVLAILFCVAFFVIKAGRHSQWNKERLYQQLITGNEEQRLNAASALAQLGAQAQLLEALQNQEPQIREMAQRGLEYLWFHSAGKDAYALLGEAYQAAQKEHYRKALVILNELVERFPDFAEGYNRRAAVFWEMGEQAKSRADCERALELNPHHYGAWQGIGICQLQMGDVTGACESLRIALRILPHDPATAESLKQCEELLQNRPSNNRPVFTRDLI